MTLATYDRLISSVEAGELDRQIAVIEARMDRRCEALSFSQDGSSIHDMEQRQDADADRLAILKAKRSELEQRT